MIDPTPDEHGIPEPDDPIVVEGLRRLGNYIAGVAAFDKWQAEHGKPRQIPDTELDPNSDEAKRARRGELEPPDDWASE